MPTMPSGPPARHRSGRSAALALLFAGALSAVLVGGCAAAPTPTPAATGSAGVGAGPAASSSPAGAPSPAPGATITAGPVPRAAATVAVRYWRLLDAHRYRGLLAVVTRDSHDAAAVRAGGAAGHWGIERVRVVSVDPIVGPAPPSGATLELSLTIAVTPTRTSAWSAGRTLVFMSLRRVGGSWLVYETGTGP